MTYDPLRAKAKVAVFTAMGVVAGLGIASGLGWTHPAANIPALDDEAQITTASVKTALEVSEAFTTVSEAVTPAVVRIESKRTVEHTAQRIPAPFREFFRIPEDEEMPPPAAEIAGGSGFIVSDDGYILTNNHVVEDAEEILVYFADRRVFEASIVGTDPFTDVAVIKVDVDEELPHLSLGDSDDVRVGEWVLAIGNPGFSSTRLDFTVTSGIISGRGRPLQLLQDELRRDPRYRRLSGFAIEDFIQTDAVINPGNSGGPLVDLRGRVIGINSAIASTTGSYQGYSFAIPINLARRIMEDLIRYGHVKRPRIGVEITGVAAEDAEVYGLPSVSGVLVQTVQDDGPASGKLQPEDVIVAIDGEPVGYVAQLQAKIAERHPGDRVTLTVYRHQRPIEVELRLDEAPLNDIPPRVTERSTHAEERLGIRVEELDAELARELGFDDADGVVLVQVIPGSPAARRGVAGFRGTRITQINDARIRSTEDVREALEAVAPGEIVSLHFEAPDGTTRVVNVRMPR